MYIWIVLIDIADGDYDNNNSDSNLPHLSIIVLVQLLIFFIKTNRTICYVPMGHCLLVALHTLLNCPEVRPGVSDVHPMSRILGCHLLPHSYLLSCFSDQVLLHFLFCPIYSATGPLS